MIISNESVTKGKFLYSTKCSYKQLKNTEYEHLKRKMSDAFKKSFIMKIIKIHTKHNSMMNPQVPITQSQKL